MMSFVVLKCKTIKSADVFFSFFPNLYFWGLLGGSKGKKRPKMTKTLSAVPYVSGSISHGLYLWYTCVKGYFFQILIFRVVRGVKGRKKAQNDKEFYVSLSISGIMPHMVVGFGTHL